MKIAKLELVTRTYCDKCGIDITYSNHMQIGDTELCTTCSWAWDDYKKTFRREADVVRCRDWAASGSKKETGRDPTGQLPELTKPELDAIKGELRKLNFHERGR